MKLKLTPFIFLLLLSATANSQYLEKDEKRAIRHAVLFAPFNFFDIENPNIQIGYELMLPSKWAFQIEGGKFIHHGVFEYLTSHDTPVKDCPLTNNGYKIRVETKRYLKDIDRKFNMYVSGELFYWKNTYGSQNSFRVSDTTFQYPTPRPAGMDGYYQFFVNRKEKYGINLIFGITLQAGNHFYFEGHGGLGVAIRNSVHSGLDNPNDKLLFEGDILESDTPGRTTLLSLPFNIKVGYRF